MRVLSFVLLSIYTSAQDFLSISILVLKTSYCLPVLRLIVVAEKEVVDCQNIPIKTSGCLFVPRLIVVAEKHVVFNNFPISIINHLEY